MENYYDYEYKPTNREKALKAKLGLSWCGGCDANLVGNGERCGVCRRIEYVNNETKKRRFKK